MNYDLLILVRIAFVVPCSFKHLTCLKWSGKEFLKDDKQRFFLILFISLLFLLFIYLLLYFLLEMDQAG